MPPGNGRQRSSLSRLSDTWNTQSMQQSSTKDLFRLTTRRIAVRIIQEAPGSRQTEKQLGDAKETGRTGEKWLLKLQFDLSPNALSIPAFRQVCHEGWQCPAQAAAAASSHRQPFSADFPSPQWKGHQGHHQKIPAIHMDGKMELIIFFGGGAMGICTPEHLWMFMP